MSSLAMGTDLSCAQIAGAMAMTIARTEPKYTIMGFTSGGNNVKTYNNYGNNVGMTDLGITAKSNLNTAMQRVQKSNFGRTDCSLPMEYAIENDLKIDSFIVITDNETYAGKRHPFQALKAYRQKTGIDAKLAVLGVAGSPFTIADPSDAGMMDFVGFDSNAPRVLADFSAGRL